MIRINLLPVRAAKKKESVRFQLTLAGLVTFFVFALSIVVYFTVRSEATGIANQITSGQKELDDLKKKIGELSRIKEQKRVVEEKLNIINTLEANRTGPTNLFKKISDAIPEKAWLMSFKDAGNVINLNGLAANDEVVAEFMRRLQRFKELGNTELEVVQRTTDKDTNTDIVSFSLRIERPR